MSEQATHIRRATVSDVEAIAALHVASWREAYAGILPDSLLADLSIESRAAMWGQVISGASGLDAAAVFVAEQEEAGRLRVLCPSAKLSPRRRRLRCGDRSGLCRRLF